MFGHTPPSHVHPPRRISFRCVHTLWCDMNPPRRFHMRRCEMNSRGGRGSWLGLFYFFFLPPFLFLSYHLSCMCMMFGRMRAELWINPEAAGRGRNLERASPQDHHQMLELFSHQAWNFVFREMIYNFTLTAEGGRKHGYREAANPLSLFIFSSPSFPRKFLTGFQCWLFIILWL